MSNAAIPLSRSYAAFKAIFGEDTDLVWLACTTHAPYDEPDYELDVAAMRTTEFTASDYARKPITVGDLRLMLKEPSNVEEIRFAEAPESDWSNGRGVRGYLFYDAPTGGQWLWAGEVRQNFVTGEWQTINPGQPFVIPAGSLRLALSDVDDD